MLKHMKIKKSARQSVNKPVDTFSRRAFVQGMSACSAVALQACGGAAAPLEGASFFGGSGGTTPTIPVEPAGSGQHPIFGADKMTRQTQAYQTRELAAKAQQAIDYGTQATNGDEGLYADYRGSYSKGLPHNAQGEVDTGAYQALLDALESAENRDFEAIPMGGVRKLANPQAAYRFEMVGLDSHKTFMRPAPEFASLETAAEMGELYWKALCRDIPFAQYESNTTIQAAINDLNAFSSTVGPKSGGKIDPLTVFRGATTGDLTGPYISQLLWQDIPYGNTSIEQRYESASSGADAMTNTASWLNVQRGGGTTPLFLGNKRYINDARALSEYVHSDFSYQAYLNAALILLKIPGSFDFDNLYNSSVTQGAFATLGGPDVLDLVAKAGNLALSGAWYQKWLVHRRARPEAYAGKLHYQKSNVKDYGLPSEILDSDGVGRTFARNETYLLPQAYSEGSPTHPAYPAGHATIAGACATVLKAYFEESVSFPDTVVASADGQRLSAYSGANLTLGGEIDKLAHNISLGRDWAGVHYRSDGEDGLLVGEQQAISLLLDYSRTYKEDFNGFNLTKFNGEKIRIQRGVIF